MSRIARDLSKAAPWHVHPRPTVSSSDVTTGNGYTNGPSKSGRHPSNFTAIPSTSTPNGTNSTSRGSSVSYSTLASSSTGPSPITQTYNPSSTMASTNPPPCPGPSIAIMGAGIASLRAATLLLRSLPPTARLTIYEPRQRVGGRLCQATLGGGAASHRVDMGPNWIHGVHGNPIMKLAERTETLTVEPEEDGDSYDAEGRRMGREEARGVAADVWEGVSEAFVYSDKESEGIGEQESLYGWFEERFEGMRRRGEGRWKGLSEEEGRRRLRDVMNEARMWGPFVGENVERQSLKFFWMEECVDGGNVFVANSYEKIVREAARPVLESGCVRFGNEVVKVEVLEGDEGVKLTVKDLADGQQRELSHEVFDEVICTAPLGWLKRHKKEAFAPPLPDRVNQAIDNISYGRLEKLYVSFPRAFWLDEPSQTNASRPSDEEDPTRPLALFTHFHHPSQPSYHPLVPPNQSMPGWNQNLVSLAHLPSPAAHPTLLFYVYGDCATSMVSSVSGLPESSERYDRVLWDFAQPWIAKLPGYREDSDNCKPVKNGILCTRWQDDKWAGNGSYACFLVGLKDGEGDVSAMRQGGGLGKEATEAGEQAGDGCMDRGPRRGGLWLAGEHTAPVVALGTTTGAWWSGEGVARRICRKWGVEVVEDDADVSEAPGEAMRKLQEETLSGGGPGGIVAGMKPGLE